MTNRKNRNSTLGALAGLTLSLVASDARAAVLFADFDLDGNGTEETSVWSTAFREPSGEATLRQAIHYGATDVTRAFTWSGLGFKGRIGKVEEGETVPPYQVVLQQTSRLAFAEKAGRFTWTDPATNATSDARAEYFAPTVGTAAVASASVVATIGFWDNPIDGLVNQLTFKSEVKDGVITHSLTNNESVELSVVWSAAGINGKIKPGETLTATVSAPAGGIERRTVAVFQVRSPGVGVTTFEAPVHHWNKAPRVPAPGPLALVGLGLVALGGRRRG